MTIAETVRQGQDFQARLWFTIRKQAERRTIDGVCYWYAEKGVQYPKSLGEVCLEEYEAILQARAEYGIFVGDVVLPIHVRKTYALRRAIWHRGKP
jgi:hypothetical protein